MIDVVWSGSAKDCSGYGSCTRSYLSNLSKYHSEEINVRLIPRNFFNGKLVSLSKEFPEVREMIVSDNEKSDCFVQNLTPNIFVYDKSIPYHIGMTTFETDGLPNDWVMKMQAMDEIWTYTRFGQSAFRSAGINRPITVIPHGVDTDKFSPMNAGFEKFKKHFKDTYVFGANFDWTDRKNPELLLKAYWKAFDGRKDVVLLLKSYFQHPVSESLKYMVDRIEECKESVDVKDFPKVYLISNIIPDSQIPEFYATLDAYVSCSSGEGWSLTASEAMATGLPTISTGWSGNTEFMNTSNSLLLDYKIVPVPASFYSRHPSYAGQNWADPSEDDLIDKMKYLYSNREKGIDLGIVARLDMVNNWTWKDAVKKMNNRLNYLFGGSQY